MGRGQEMETPFGFPRCSVLDLSEPAASSLELTLHLCQEL